MYSFIFSNLVSAIFSFKAIYVSADLVGSDISRRLESLAVNGPQFRGVSRKKWEPAPDWLTMAGKWHTSALHDSSSGVVIVKFSLRTGLVVKLTMVFFVFRYCLRCSKDLELVSWRRRSSGEGFATKIVPKVRFFYIEIEDGIRCRRWKCLHLDWVFFGYSGRRYISVNIPRLIYIAQVWVYGIVLATMFLKPSS